MQQTRSFPAFEKACIIRFWGRSTLDKVLCGGVVVSATFFTVGFSAPAWMNYFGLWVICDSKGNCKNMRGSVPYSGWLVATCIMECLALLFFWMSVAIWLYQDCLKLTRTMLTTPVRKSMEGTALAAGIFGLIGVTVFGAETEGVRNLSATPGFRHAGIPAGTLYLDWGFWMTTCACILVVICAVVLYFERRSPKKSALPTNGVFPQPHLPQPSQSWAMPAVMPPLGQAMPMQEMERSSPPKTSEDPAFYVCNQGMMTPVYQRTGETSASRDTQAAHPVVRPTWTPSPACRVP